MKKQITKNMATLGLIVGLIFILTACSSPREKSPQIDEQLDERTDHQSVDIQVEPEIDLQEEADGLEMDVDINDYQEELIDSEPGQTDNKALLYFFWGDGCPYCITQKVFLDRMEEKYPNLEIKMFETWKDRDNAQILQEMAQAYGVRASGVPMTFIGDFEPMIGFASRMEADLEEKIKYCLEEGCIDPALK